MVDPMDHLSLRYDHVNKNMKVQTTLFAFNNKKRKELQTALLAKLPSFRNKQAFLNLLSGLSVGIKDVVDVDELYTLLSGTPEPDKIKKFFTDLTVKFREKNNVDEYITIAKAYHEMMRNPQLERENYKIDTSLSDREKLKNGWKKVKNFPKIFPGRTKTSLVTVLLKVIAGQMENPWVWEFIDDGITPKNMVGQQEFNRNVMLALGLDKTVPTKKQMEIMKGDDATMFVEKFFENIGATSFAKFRDVETSYNYPQSSFWLQGGRNMDLVSGKIDRHDNDPHYGHPVRRLKENI